MARHLRTASVWGPPILLMAVIFAFSSMPSDDVERGTLHVLSRKLVHVGEYALLFALWWRALRTKLAGRTAVGLAFAVCVAYAATDEWHQSFVDGRIGTPVDVAIDAAGAACAAAVVLRRRVQAVLA